MCTVDYPRHHDRASDLQTIYVFDTRTPSYSIQRRTLTISQEQDHATKMDSILLCIMCSLRLSTKPDLTRRKVAFCTGRYRATTTDH